MVIVGKKLNWLDSHLTYEENWRLVASVVKIALAANKDELLVTKTEEMDFSSIQ